MTGFAVVLAVPDVRLLDISQTVAVAGFAEAVGNRFLLDLFVLGLVRPGFPPAVAFCYFRFVPGSGFLLVGLLLVPWICSVPLFHCFLF